MLQEGPNQYICKLVDEEKRGPFYMIFKFQIALALVNITIKSGFSNVVSSQQHLKT